MQVEMEEQENTTTSITNSGGAGIGGIGPQWWWAAAGTGQLSWGILAFRAGCSSHLMPLKAFAVASLFVGAIGSAATASLHACGIHCVEDMKTTGASIGTALRVPQRPQNTTK